MLATRIQQQFIDSADLKYQCAQTLAPAVEAATGAVVSVLTAGGKVLAAGCGASAGGVQAFVAGFLGRFERERPELAAYDVSASASTLSALYGTWGARDVFARPVRALGAPGDLLLLVTAQAPSEEIQGAIAAAHERDMVVLALGALPGGPWRALLKDTDVLIAAPGERAPRIHEVHQMVLHCIADGIDVQLLGDDAEPEMPS